MINIRDYIESIDTQTWISDFVVPDVDPTFYKNMTLERYLDFEFGFSYRHGVMHSSPYWTAFLIYYCDKNTGVETETVLSSNIRILVYNLLKYSDESYITIYALPRRQTRMNQSKRFIFDTRLLFKFMDLCDTCNENCNIYEKLYKLLIHIIRDASDYSTLYYTPSYHNVIKNTKTKFRNPYVYLYRGYYEYKIKATKKFDVLLQSAISSAPLFSIKYNGQFVYANNLLKFFIYDFKSEKIALPNAFIDYYLSCNSKIQELENQNKNKYLEKGINI